MEMKPTYEELEAQVKRLAAENAALKFAINAVYRTAEDCEFNGDELKYVVEPSEFDALTDLLDETLATDAAIASLRAEGVEWIEGNTPEKFGRYWVRYETDVGPRYCSAQWIEHNFCASSNTNIHKIWLADHSRSINRLKGVTHYTRLPEPIEGGSK